MRLRLRSVLMALVSLPIALPAMAGVLLLFVRAPDPPVSQTQYFGALTLAGAGAVAPTLNSGTITSASIASQTPSGVFQCTTTNACTTTGAISPAAGGAVGSNCPCTVNMTVNGNVSFAVTIQPEANTYSVASDADITNAIAAIGTASSGARDIAIRPGSYSKITLTTKNYANIVTWRKHTSQSTKPIIAGVSLTAVNRLVIDGLELFDNINSDQVVRLSTMSGFTFTLTNSYVHGKYWDPTVDYSIAPGYLGITDGIATSGSAAAALVVTNNIFQNLDDGVRGLNVAVGGTVTFTGNSVDTVFEDGANFSWVGTITATDNTYTNLFGALSDIPSAHSDCMQVVGSGAGHDVTVDFERNICTPVLNGAKGIWVSDAPVGIFATGTISYNVFAGGPPYGIHVGRAKSMIVLNNTEARKDHGGASPVLDNIRIDIGTDQTSGTHDIENNVAELLSIAGSSTQVNNVTIGINGVSPPAACGATNGYPCVYDGAAGSFIPTGPANALVIFAPKNGGPLDAATCVGAIACPP